MINDKEEIYLTKLITKAKEKCENQYGVKITDEIVIDKNKTLEQNKQFIIQLIQDDLQIKKENKRVNKIKRAKNPFPNIEKESYKHILKNVPDEILDLSDGTDIKLLGIRELDYNGLVAYVKKEHNIEVPEYIDSSVEQARIERELLE